MPFTTDDRNIGLMTYKKMTIDNLSSANDDTFGKVGYGLGLFHCDQEEFENTWTIAMWVKRAAWTTNGSNDILCCKNTSASTYCQWYFSQVGGKLNIGVNAGAGSYSVPFTFTNNVWIHVAAVYDGKTVFLYGNGELLGSKVLNSSMLTGCTNIGIACRSTKNDGSSYTGGNSYLSDFRVYSHALEAWEIKKIYNSMSFGIIGGLYLEPAYNSNTANNKLLTETAYNGANSKYGYNDASNLKKETVVVNNVLCDKVTARSGNTSFYPYVFFSPLHPLNGTYKTLSFDYYPTSQDRIIPYTYGGNANAKWVSNYSVCGSGNNVSSVTIPVDANKWNHIDITLQGISSASTGWGYIRVGAAKHTSNLSNYWLFKNIQITELDHPIEYTYENRDERFVDLASDDSQIISYNVSKSGSTLYFNGSSSYVSIPGRNLTGGSVSMWVYVQTKQSVQRVLYFDPTSKMGIGFLASGRLCCAMNDINTNSYNAANFVYGDWNHIVVVYGTNRQPSACYINGVSETATTESTWWRYSGTNAAIGKRLAGGNADVLLGYVKSVSVYTKQLSAEDAMNLYIHGQ